MRTVDRVEILADELISPKGYEVVDVEFRKDGSRKVLRLFVDRLETGITLDEISEITRLVSDRLDEEDFIEEEYILEVSSPGITRVIKKEKDFTLGTYQRIKDHGVVLECRIRISVDIFFDIVKELVEADPVIT